MGLHGSAAGGGIRRLIGVDNPEIKSLVRLHDRRGRRAAGMMLLEGPHLLREALAAGQSLVSAYFLSGWERSPEGEELLSLASARGIPLTEITPPLMAKVSTTDTPPPVLATAALAGHGLPRGSGQYGLVLDGLQDPGNLGTILRIAWGTGAGTVWATPGTTDYCAPKVLRAGQGAHFHLALAEVGYDELLAAVERDGWWLVAATPGAPVPFWRGEFRLPCLVCIGSEARGISTVLAAAAHEHVSLPLAPGVDSLNAAVCAGVVLYEVVRRVAATGAHPREG